MFRGPSIQWCCRRYHRKWRYTGNRYGGHPNRKLPTLNLHDSYNKSPTNLQSSLKMEIQRPRKFENLRWNFSFLSARDVVTSGLDVCDIYFRYKTTPYNTKLRTVELLDLENMSIAIVILLLCALQLKIWCEPQLTTNGLHTSGFCAAVFDFW